MPPARSGVALGLSVLGILVTSGAHLPLNEDLVAAGDPDNITNLAAVRDNFESPWKAWNVVRTILHTAALACLAPALAHHGRDTPKSAPAPARATVHR